MPKNKPSLMNDLTEHARKVDEAPDVETARLHMMSALNALRFKAKNDIFVQAIKAAATKERLQKLAWNLVLRGDELQTLRD